MDGLTEGLLKRKRKTRRLYRTRTRWTGGRSKLRFEETTDRKQEIEMLGLPRKGGTSLGREKT